MIDHLTPDQRAAYHEAARAHSIPALVAWLATVAVAAIAFAVQLASRGDA